MLINVGFEKQVGLGIMLGKQAMRHAWQVAEQFLTGWQIYSCSWQRCG